MKSLLIAALLLATPAWADEVLGHWDAEDEYATCLLGTSLVWLLKTGAPDVENARGAAFGLCYDKEPADLSESNKDGLRQYVDFSLQAVADKLYPKEAATQP